MIRRTLRQLLDLSVLPSGIPFVLKDDTVDIGVQVGEVNDSNPAMKKVREITIITQSINGIDVPPGANGHAFIGALPDTDVAFLGLAWNIQARGDHIKIPGVPCPACSALFTTIDIGNFGLSCRETPSPQEFYPVDVAPTMSGIDGGQVVVTQPSWLAVRKDMPIRSWGNLTLVDTYRAMAGLHVVRDTGRFPLPRTKTGLWRTSQMDKVVETLNANVPSFEKHIVMKCARCGGELDVPFDHSGMMESGA